MEPNKLTLLIDAINSLADKMHLLLLLLAIFYFSVLILIGIKGYTYVREKDEIRELKDADFLIDKGLYDELLSNCKNVLVYRKKNVQTHWYMALCYYHKGDFDNAVRFFELVELLNPNWGDACQVYVCKINSLVTSQDLPH